MTNWVQRYWHSLITRILLSMVIIGVTAMVGQLLSVRVAQGVQGDATAINTIGAMRMQSYRLLAAVPLGEEHAPLVRQFEAVLSSAQLSQALGKKGELRSLEALQLEWGNTLKPALAKAGQVSQARGQVEDFVGQLDALVTLFEQDTERRLGIMLWLQYVFIAAVLLFLVFSIWELRRHIFLPLNRLLEVVGQISGGDFSARAATSGRLNELGTLAKAINHMAGELDQLYADLEQRIQRKTRSLVHRNRTLDFLYRSGTEMVAVDPYPAVLTPMLEELCDLAGLSYAEVAIADLSQSGLEQVIHVGQPGDPRHEQRSWLLKDEALEYGHFNVEFCERPAETDGGVTLLETFANQITTLLAKRQRQHQQQQLLIAEERSTIARELHDSIAQSLSSLKMRTGVLQMQSADMAPQQALLLGEIRQEIDAAYRQLRQLLATFRLKDPAAGFFPALKETVAEFSKKLGCPIGLDYTLPANALSPHQGGHVLHIVREALANVYKHAGANEVSLRLSYDKAAAVARVVIADDGQGMDSSEPNQGHYGLVIMADRAKSLSGTVTVDPNPGGGTRVALEFPLHAPEFQ